VSDKFKKTARIARTIVAIAGLMTGTMVVAQQATDDQSLPDTGLDIPNDLQIFGTLDPNVRKATAIVNGTVITETDVDQRVAMIAAANNTTSDKIPADDLNRLRLQVLRQLIDESLEIQEAGTEDIKITPAEINDAYVRVAPNFHIQPKQLAGYLRGIGSSERSLKRQIEGELAWRRYLQRRVEPLINVGDEEVNAIIARMKAAQGTEEYHLKEIYMSAPADRSQQVFNTEQQIMQDIQKGGKPFEYYASTVSEATTRATGGDLGWIRPATLPDALADAAAQMQVGQVAGPIQLTGGFSILYLVDKRQVLTADPRDARLSLKQLTIHFPKGTTQAQATQQAAAFGAAVKDIRGCGDVEKMASQIGAEVVDNDTVIVRQLPPQLQQIVLQLQVGQATPPFGSVEDGIRALVLCGRDDPQTGQVPSASQIQGQLEDQRVNLRAEQKLRDLRRDAIIEYR
jgi:peptidyl-prolyl cis-trans isomerase SurA